MLSGIWTKLLAFGGFLLAIGLGLLKVFNAGKDVEKGKQADAALKVKDKSTQAMIDGLVNEEKVKHEKVDTSKRDHFE